MRIELAGLQRRLARKIEVCSPGFCVEADLAFGTPIADLTWQLISPILESIEFQFTRGNTALESCVRIARDLREDIDALAARLQDAAALQEQFKDGGAKKSASPLRRAELVSILAEMKQLMLTIDDSIPSINLWVSAIGGIQSEPSSFSPSRLLQASMLVNVGDTQFVIDPSQPMQIGPDFTLSLYMLFRGHASPQDGDAYGFEDGQRKPTWQEVIHKARVRLYRVPTQLEYADMYEMGQGISARTYAYQLQIVEDLDDGRVHTFEDGSTGPGSYDGIPLAGIRELIPVGQISKMFYADVGRILNINNEDGASSNPVLLLKRDTTQLQPAAAERDDEREQQARILETIEEPSFTSEPTPSESSAQDDIDRQLREESQAAEPTQDTPAHKQISPARIEHQSLPRWTIPHNLDPEWLALEVFEINDSESSTDDDESEAAGEDESNGHGNGMPAGQKHPKPQTTTKTSIDGNLVNQLHRMSLASGAVPSSRPSTSHSHSHPYPPSHHPSSFAHFTSTELTRPSDSQQPLSATASVTGAGETAVAPPSPTLMERSPFGAIRTSLSLLEMLLRLTSLQEFEQSTHLAIPDHVLKFYLDESASESGLRGKERWAARAEVARKVGFDPYVDGPDGGGDAHGTGML